MEYNRRQDWNDLSDIMLIFGVSKHWVTVRHQKGLIRSKKLGPTRQARRVYCGDDVVRALLAERQKNVG